MRALLFFRFFSCGYSFRSVYKRQVIWCNEVIKMKSSRLFLCILLTFLLLYLALPRLPITAENGMGNWFSFTWLLFAFLVLGGNVYSWLIEREKSDRNDRNTDREWGKRKRNRQRKKVYETL